MRVVLDTNVLISATLWNESVSQKLLFKLIKFNVLIYSSLEILSEYKKVLKRDFDYSEAEIFFIIEKVVSFMNIIETFVRLDVVKDDEDDNKIVECAAQSLADYIITYDKHLLKIKKYKDIKIITPEEALKII